MLVELLVTAGGIATGMTLYQKHLKGKHSGQWLEDLRRATRRTSELIFGNERNQQLLSLSSEEETDTRRKTEKIINRKVAVSVISTGFATAGLFLYAPLGLLCLPGIIYVSKDIFVSGYRSLVHQRKANVDVISGLCKIFLLISGHLFICSTTTVIFAVNRKLLNKVKSNAKGNLVNVFRQQPRVAWVLQEGVECEVPVAELKQDAIVVVGAGETIPVDGEIISGSAYIDQHILTGESQPAEKSCGDQVFSATIVLSGNIQIKVDKVGEQTTAAQIGMMLNQTADIKTDQQLKAEEFSDKTVLPTLALSAFAFPFFGPTSALVILQSHFKYRMNIVSAIGLLNYLNLASQSKLLIKDGRAFERISSVDTVVFDKTGTLTEEMPQVAEIHVCAENSADNLLRYAAAAEGKQTHPIARAIIAEAQVRELDLPVLDEAEYQVGYGLSARLDQRQVQVGSVRFMALMGLDLSDELQQCYDTCCDRGNTLILVAVDNQLIGGIELCPTIRPEAQEIISGLSERGVTATYIISGDHEAPTRKLANTLGIKHYFAGVLPEQKADLIKQLQSEGRSVCFIGDGINDCIAMKQADISVSLGDASTVAIDSSQVILLDNSLKNLHRLFDLSKQFMKSTKICATAILLPSIVGMSGALFSGLGLAQVLLLSQLGLMVAVTTSVYPVLKHSLSETDEK